MYYEINVAKLNSRKEYSHYFATAKRSLTNSTTAQKVLKDLLSKFPEPEYKITISYTPEVSKGCDAKEFIDNPDCIYF